MASTKFEFQNAAGRRLAGVLETGAGRLRAFALFAHCFTCSKSSLAAVRVSRGLAERGIGVLRFDFTGLGDSEGEFGGGLSSDAADLVAAAAAMAGRDMPVRLLIGHSFGGAAVIAAASDLPGVKAVATLGAPSSAEHVLGKIEGDLDHLPDDGTVEVSIAGRPFRLGAAFARDLRAQNQAGRITGLGRALLVMHSPVDQVVGIDNATRIFLPARHPKSFVSLDKADHFLSKGADADYAAAVIAAWSAPYVGSGEVVESDAEPAAGVRVAETGAGKFQVEVSAGGTRFFADEPADLGGQGSGPTPYDLFGAALGACTTMTLRLYADRKAWSLARVSVQVSHQARTATTKDRFERDISLEGDLDSEQRARLMEMADKCPVHRTITEGAEVVTRAVGEAPTPADDHGDHFQCMDAACAEAGA